MSLTRCKECGVDVRWAKNERGRRVPLEQIHSNGLVVDNTNTARGMSIYKFHECDPEVADKYMDRLADGAEMGRLVEEHRLRLYEEALKFECSKCAAVVYQECWNLSDRRNDVDQVRHTRYPHSERLPEPKRIELEKQSPLFEGKYN